MENFVWLLVDAEQMLIFAFTQPVTQKKKNLYLNLVKFPNEGYLLVGVHFPTKGNSSIWDLRGKRPTGLIEKGRELDQQ